MTTSFTSRQLATNYEILVARTEFLVALATRKAQFRTLMLQNLLKLNKSKTELLILNAKHCPSPPTCIATVTIGDAVINPSKTARNIGVVFDSSPSMEEHVKASCKSAFFQLTNIAQIQKHSPAQAAETLIHSLVTLKVDFCNSLLYDVPNQLIWKLQSIQNSVARLLTYILTSRNTLNPC